MRVMLIIERPSFDPRFRYDDWRDFFKVDVVYVPLPVQAP